MPGMYWLLSNAWPPFSSTSANRENGAFGVHNYAGADIEDLQDERRLAGAERCDAGLQALIF